MTQPLQVIDRTTKKIIQEDVWGAYSLRLLYGTSFVSKTIGRALLHAFVRWPLFSWTVGKYYDSRWSRHLIQPFCNRFHINMEESQLAVDECTSFNDFFTRRLRPECRPQAGDTTIVTAPADGRYTLLENLGSSSQICVKGESLSLAKLLGSSKRAAHFYGGSGIVCRLCPADCHRFYFPVAGIASDPIWINGPLFSVNPIATKAFPWIFWKNRRVITFLKTEHFGSVAYLEIGATNCGSITQTYVPNNWVRKGDEKGFFKLGGSAIILLFEPGEIEFEKDLLELKKSGLEILCHIGQPLARFCSAKEM